jgi:hypothetical protein
LRESVHEGLVLSILTFVFLIVHRLFFVG